VPEVIAQASAESPWDVVEQRVDVLACHLLNPTTHASGESANTIANALGVSRATVYRVLAEEADSSDTSFPCCRSFSPAAEAQKVAQMGFDPRVADAVVQRVMQNNP